VYHTADQLHLLSMQAEVTCAQFTKASCCCRGKLYGCHSIGKAVHLVHFAASSMRVPHTWNCSVQLCMPSHVPLMSYADSTNASGAADVLIDTLVAHKQQGRQSK
jgi:hypothetical protein